MFETLVALIPSWDHFVGGASVAAGVGAWSGVKKAYTWVENEVAPLLKDLRAFRAQAAVAANKAVAEAKVVSAPVAAAVAPVVAEVAAKV
jgi:hypothetical protein